MLLHPVQCRNSPHRVSKYQEYEHEWNISGIQYSVNIKDINKFEHQNNISVNVYGYENKKIFPLRITTMTAATHHVNLLYITADKIEVLKNHLRRCKLQGVQKIKLPKADCKKGRDKVNFTKTEYQLRLSSTRILKTF